MHQRDWLFDLVYLAWQGNDPLSPAFDQMFCDMPILGEKDGTDIMGMVLMGGEL